MSPRLAFAIETAYRAGRSTLSRFNTGAAVDLKADETPVTAADRDAERMIRVEIEKAFPKDGILGEEEGEQGSSAARWVVDPIDGTKSFISGVPLYATLIAYEVEEQPVIGVCYFPALDEMVYAEHGAGAFWNGRACRVSGVASLTGAVITTGSYASMAKAGRLDGYRAIERRVMAARTWGDAYGHALVATGRVAAMLDPIVSRWDLSAMAIIVREAGGRFSDFNGNEAIAQEAISSNGLTHEEILEAFKR